MATLQIFLFGPDPAISELIDNLSLLWYPYKEAKIRGEEIRRSPPPSVFCECYLSGVSG